MATIQGKNRFLVTTDNGTSGEVLLGSFKSVGGLTKEVETTEWKTGDMLSVAQLPGNTKYGKIVLKKGFDAGNAASDWFGAVSSLDPCSAVPAVMYRTVYIYVIDRNCRIFKKIRVASAWPSKYEADDLDSMSNDPWLETLEISNSGWEYIVVADPTALPPNPWITIDGSI